MNRYGRYRATASAPIQEARSWAIHLHDLFLPMNYLVVLNHHQNDLGASLPSCSNRGLVPVLDADCARERSSYSVILNEAAILIIYDSRRKR
jgi:hypothetical protein